ncbi:transposase [Nonomuraea sp. NPDC003727]
MPVRSEWEQDEHATTAAWYATCPIADAIRNVVDNGGKWRNLPAEFPPWRTVHAIFSRWRQDLYVRHNDLREHVRLAEGRQAEPSTGIIDSQSLRGSRGCRHRLSRIQRGQERAGQEAARHRGRPGPAADLGAPSDTAMRPSRTAPSSAGS